MNEVSPTFIGLLVVGLTALLALPIAWKKFMGAPEARSISPQPLEVKEVKEPRTAGDCEKKHEEVDDRIRAVEDRANANMSLIREELRDMRKGQGYLQKQVNNMSRPLFAIAGKMGIVMPIGPEDGE